MNKILLTIQIICVFIVLFCATTSMNDLRKSEQILDSTVTTTSEITYTSYADTEEYKNSVSLPKTNKVEIEKCQNDCLKNINYWCFKSCGESYKDLSIKEFLQMIINKEGYKYQDAQTIYKNDETIYKPAKLK